MERITITGAESAIAAVPLILGFRPRDSLVILWITEGQVALAQRVDLPGVVDTRWGTAVVRSARYAGATEALDLWVCHRRPSPIAVQAVHGALDSAGVTRVSSIATDGEHWFAEGAPFTQRVRLSRDHRWEGPERSEFSVDPVGRPVIDAVEVPFSAQEMTELVSTVVTLLDAGDGEPGRVVERRIAAGLTSTQVRDAVLWHLCQRPSRCRPLADLLASILRHTARGVSAHLACTCAMAYWLTGDGFRASVALERCLDEQPDHVLGRLLAAALSLGLPPQEWVRRTRGTPNPLARDSRPAVCEHEKALYSLESGQESQH